MVSAVLLVARVSINNRNSTVRNTRFRSIRFEILSVHSHTRLLSKPIACKLGGGKAPRLSEVHCDRDSVCVKIDT